MRTTLIHLNRAFALSLLVALSSWGQPVSDTTPPALQQITIEPAAVDVTTAASVVEITMQFEDDLSGVKIDDPFGTTGTLSLESPLFQVITVYTWEWELVSANGDYTSSTWKAFATIPQGADSGVWTTSLYVADRAGNVLSLPETSATLEVTSTPDEVPPLVSELIFRNAAFEPVNAITIDTSTGPQRLTFEFRVTDESSGFGPPEENAIVSDWAQLQIAAHFLDQLGDTFTYNYNSYAERISGTPQDGIWRSFFDLPQFSPAGRWELEFNLWDNAGNNAFYLSRDLGIDPSTPPQLTVESVPSDSTAPTAKALSFSPITIDTSGADQEVTISLTLEDDLAGSHYAWLTLVSPSGNQRRQFFLQSTVPVPPLTETLQTVGRFPRYSEGGTWKVLYLQLVDRASNGRFYLSDAPAIIALNASLNIIFATLSEDGQVGPAGGTVNDAVFGDKAQVTVPAGVLSQNTSVAIDVLEDPLDIPLPTGFAGANSYYVNIHLTPTPAYPLPPPGLTIVLPLVHPMVPATVLDLYRINPATGELEPAYTVAGNPVQGTVNTGGLTATFTGIASLSTVVALLPDAEINWSNPADIVYGTPLSDSQLDATANVNGNFTYDPPAGTVLGAGQAQPLSVTFTPVDLVNYRPVQKTVLINVERAQLTITADDKTKIAGEPLPLLTVSYDGFVNNDTPASLTTPPVPTTTADANSPAGLYDITVDGASSPNYKISYETGTLTVLPSETIELSVSAYKLTASRRKSLNVWEYTYRFVMVNGGTGPAFQVSAQLHKVPSNVTVVDGAVSFGNVAAGQTVTSQDTFKLRIDRTKPLQAGSMEWKVTYASDSGGTTPITIYLPY